MLRAFEFSPLRRLHTECWLPKGMKIERHGEVADPQRSRVRAYY